MPNITVPAISGALPVWSPTISDAARSILHTVTRHLDGLRTDVERELAEHKRCRRDVEALIERLIAGLDDVDGEEDREVLDEGDELDHGELDEVDRETTAVETAGRGFILCGDDDAEDGGDREADDADIDGNEAAIPFDWKEEFNGIFLSFKGESVVHAHACPVERRAGA